MKFTTRTPGDLLYSGSHPIHRQSATHSLAASILLALVLGPASSFAAAAPVAVERGLKLETGHFPGMRLGGITRGEAALRGMGDLLPDVARAYGRDPDDLRAQFRHDHTLAADSEGRLHFTCDPLPADPMLLVPQVPAEVATYPLASTFQLHTRPGSKKTIYLDFNGHILSGTAWNSGYTGGATIVAPAFDLDGDPTTFNSTELTRIQQIWRRVAEDYSAFDIDVTTELTSESVLTRTSTSDDIYGIRVLISPISTYFGNYGGLTYTGCFDQVGDTLKPSLVFPEKLANAEKYIAEAISHEAGHSLGLSHDGTTTTAYYLGQGSGETGWAPIMGAGYYQNVTQWSRGEYANANNKEDDIAVIMSNGVAPVPDTFGNTDATAGYLSASPTFSISDFLGLGNDVDVVEFAAGTGPATITVSPAGAGPDLDIGIELYDSQGVLLASSSPADRLGATLSLNLASGGYFLHIHATGMGDPLTTGYTAYGSQGAYTLKGTVADPRGTVPPVAVAAANSTTGLAPFAASFNGSGSFDQDGLVVSYAWDFGDGTTAVGATSSHSYGKIGTYNATLTVTDNQGLSNQDILLIQVLGPNLSPIAKASAAPATGPAALTVTLDGTASSDPDGSIVSYVWNFGDGTAAGSGSKVQHTYQSAGSFTARLTVTDNRGATAAASVLIQASTPPPKIIRVQSLALTLQNNTQGVAGTVSIKVTATDGTAVQGVNVAGSWGGIVTGSASASTDATGTATIVSKRTRSTGTLSFTVLSLTKTGCIYTPAQNLVTTVSVSAAKSL